MCEGSAAAATHYIERIALEFRFRVRSSGVKCVLCVSARNAGRDSHKKIETENQQQRKFNDLDSGWNA